MPTAIGEGQIASEGSIGKLSVCLQVPSDQHRSSAFAVGMLRKVAKNRRTLGQRRNGSTVPVYRHVCRNVYGHGHRHACRHANRTCIDMCVDVRVNRRTERIEMCIDMCVDMCIDMCIGM